MGQLEPTPPRERLLTLDVLRGFALLGVLLGNIYWDYSGRMLRDTPDAGRLDRGARFLIEQLVQSKAQTLLCFLFGFGFAAQLLRARQRQQPIVPLYVRRLVVLLGFGCLHLCIFWGDVTWTYAIGGFGLLLFLRCSNRTRLAWALFLALVPETVLAFKAVHDRFMAPFGGWAANWAHLQTALQTALTTHNPLVATRNQYEVALRFSGPMVLTYFPWVLARFVAGYVAGDQGWFERDGADHLPLFRRMLAVGATLGVLGCGGLWLLHHGYLHAAQPPKIWQVVLAQLGRQLDYLGLAAAYMAALVLLMQRPAPRRVLALLAPVGRMPLTTYLSQSVASTFIFYGWGLGRAFTMRSAAAVSLALGIFALQVLVARLWLRHFRFGPAEWLWRALVYRRRPPMRVR